MKYAASSRPLLMLSGSSLATRRRSSSIETPSKYSRAVVTVSRHYIKGHKQRTSTRRRRRLPLWPLRLSKQPQIVAIAGQTGISSAPRVILHPTRHEVPLITLREFGEGTALQRVVLEKEMTLWGRDGYAVAEVGVMPAVTNKCERTGMWRRNTV